MSNFWGDAVDNIGTFTYTCTYSVMFSPLPVPTLTVWVGLNWLGISRRLSIY